MEGQDDGHVPLLFSPLLSCSCSLSLSLFLSKSVNGHAPVLVISLYLSLFPCSFLFLFPLHSFPPSKLLAPATIGIFNNLNKRRERGASKQHQNSSNLSHSGGEGREWGRGAKTLVLVDCLRKPPSPAENRNTHTHTHTHIQDYQSFAHARPGVDLAFQTGEFVQLLFTPALGTGRRRRRPGQITSCVATFLLFLNICVEG